MLSTVRCAHCAARGPSPSSPNARCPPARPRCGAARACRAPGCAGTRLARARWTQTEIAPGELPVRPAATGTWSWARGRCAVASRPPARSSPGVTGGPRPGEPRARRRWPPPAWPTRRPSSLSRQGGIPLLPIGIGVGVILAVTAFALVRGRPRRRPPRLPPSPGWPARPAPGADAPAVAGPVTAPPPVAVDAPVDRTAPAAERPGTPSASRRLAPPTRRHRPPARSPAPAGGRRRPPGAGPAPVPAPRTSPNRRCRHRRQFVAAPAPPPPPPRPAGQRSGPRAGGLPESPGRPRRAASSNSLRMPRDLVDVGGETATVKFAVDEAGQVSQFSYLSGRPTSASPRHLVRVQRCEWIPAPPRKAAASRSGSPCRSASASSAAHRGGRGQVGAHHPGPVGARVEGVSRRSCARVSSDRCAAPSRRAAMGGAAPRRTPSAARRSAAGPAAGRVSRRVRRRRRL